MAKKRRGNAEGSVFYREDRMLWAATITIGYDEQGKRRRRTMYAATKQEVLDKLAEQQGQVRTGSLPEPQRMTYGRFSA